MNKLGKIVLACFTVLLIIFLFLLGTYFTVFSDGISNQTDDWILFVSMCNLGFISLLSGLNVWVFYRLTLKIATNENTQFVENKISRTEDALLELRLSEFKQFLQDTVNLKVAIYSEQSYESELRAVWKDLNSMSTSIVFSSVDSKTSVLEPIINNFHDVFSNRNIQPENLIEQIDKSINAVEVLIFTSQLRDDRIFNEFSEHPNRFDPTLSSIHNKLNQQ